MTNYDRIIEHLLNHDAPMSEAQEPEEFIETKRRLRRDTAARVEASYTRAFGAVPEGDIGFTSGSRTFVREGGVWYEETRQNNPEYYDLPNYFIIYPGPAPHAFIVGKHPRRLTQRLFSKATMQIFKDATGESWSSASAGVDGAEKEIFDRRVSGEKPEPAYEIFQDGTWKRLK